MNRRPGLGGFCRKAILRALHKLADPGHSVWIEAVLDEASRMEEGRIRWIAGGLLAIAGHRLGRKLPPFFALCLLPLVALALFSLLARLQFLLWDFDSPLVGPIMLAVSIAPFAWQLGQQVRSRALVWAVLAFALFQSAPAIFWPVMFGEPIGLEWGIDVQAMGLPQRAAPLLALALWVGGAIAAQHMKSRPPAF